MNVIAYKLDFSKAYPPDKLCLTTKTPTVVFDLAKVACAATGSVKM
jgi:hypothetical protein